MTPRAEVKCEPPIESTSPENLPSFEIPTTLDITPPRSTRCRRWTAADKEWREYVSRLEPGDRTGKFLLADELPTARSSPRQIRGAIGTATRRAYGLDRGMDIVDYVRGRIHGVMLIMLPQGGEVVHVFHNELGWKATVVLSENGEKHAFPVYYRSVCMNPVRVLELTGGTVDTSQVEFTPLDEREAERVHRNGEVDRFTMSGLLGLAAEYGFRSYIKSHLDPPISEERMRLLKKAIGQGVMEERRKGGG